MFAKLDHLIWHDGVLHEIHQHLPDGNRAPSVVRITVSIYTRQSQREPRSFLLTFSGVERMTQFLDAVELADNAGAGNIIHAYWSKKKGKAQHFVMNLYDG